METVRIGVIGAGRMGQRHCRVLANMRRVQLAGVYDPHAGAGIRAAQLYSVPFCHTLDQLLAQCDAVVIAAPTPFHFDLATNCLSRGLHVLIEKPVTETLDQAERLAAAAERSGLVAQVGHIEHFNPAYAELKHVMESLTPLAIEFRRLSPFEGSNTDVDVVLDLMIHDANLVLDLLGQEPAWISGIGLRTHSDQLDYASAHLGYDSGPIVHVTASRVTETKVRAIKVTSREAYVECNLLNRGIEVHRSTIGEYGSPASTGFKYRQESLVEQIYVPNQESLFLELQHFADCIFGGVASAVTVRDGLNSLRLALRIRRAIQEQSFGGTQTLAELPLAALAPAEPAEPET